MDGMVIMGWILLIVSAICFVVSFLIPEKKPEGSGINQELALLEVQEMVRNEAENLWEPMGEMARECVEYAAEASAKTIEDFSNEKMHAINERADLLFQEMQGRQEEVGLLHKVIGEEHDKLKETVAAASRAAQTMQESVKKIQSMRPVEVTYGKESVKIVPMASKTSDESGNGRKQGKVSGKS